MTSTLLLRLRGPMQSWGDSSRYSSRHTRPYPTKSGLLGVIAAAQGRRRTDDIEDLTRLSLGVRIDQPGTIMRDYQTAEQWQTGGGTSLVSRYYLSDAVFLVAVSAESAELLGGIEDALRKPRFPLFLGRRSCPANPDLVIGVEEGDAAEHLRDHPWQARPAHRATRPSTVVLPIFRDALPDDPEDMIAEERQDVPLSFDPRHRRYGWRRIVADHSRRIDNPEGRGAADPFFEAVVSA